MIVLTLLLHLTQDILLKKIPVEVDTGLDTIGCEVDGPESSGNLTTGLACDIESSSNEVISGPLVATTKQNFHLTKW